jgi:hypothetical protein
MQRDQDKAGDYTARLSLSRAMPDIEPTKKS